MSSVDLKKMHLISVVWGAILIFIVLSLTLFGFYFKKQTKVYTEFEVSLEEKVKDYLLNHSVTYEKSYSLDHLVELGVIDSKEVNHHVCEGYVQVSFDNELYQTDAFVHCGMYKTRGYE